MGLLCSTAPQWRSSTKSYGVFLQSNCAGCASVWLGIVGHIGQDNEATPKFPQQGSKVPHEATHLMQCGWVMGSPQHFWGPLGGKSWNSGQIYLETAQNSTRYGSNLANVPGLQGFTSHQPAKNSLVAVRLNCMGVALPPVSKTSKVVVLPDSTLEFARV